MHFIAWLMAIMSFHFTFALNTTFANSNKSWQQIKIPGAKCGNGSDYTVYYKENSSTELLIEFMSGGACWNKRSCVNIPFTWIYPIIELPSFSLLTSSKDKMNPFKDHSFLYFPYCTGDVFTGSRVSNYEGTNIYHQGYKNIVLVLEYLSKNKIVPFQNVKDLIVWGSSAGGIGALTHGKNIESYIPPNSNKTLIADSPGLHFGPTFWNRFQDDAKKDFKAAFNSVHLEVDFSDGFVARKMGPLLDYYREWNVGFLYGLRDTVMSNFFGSISKKEHQQLILSDQGLPSIAAKYSNSKVWLSDSNEHIFLISKKTSRMMSVDGIKAIDFVKAIHQARY